jgi:hypothetical protein
MKPIRLYVIVLAVLALACAGCARSPWVVRGPELLNQVPPQQQPAPRAPGFPRGRFSSVSMPNMVLLAIENDGHFHIMLGDDILDSGNFEVARSQVWVDSVACEAQQDAPALYDWVYDEEDGLAFRPADPDPCAERRQYLSEQYVPKYMFVFNVPDRGTARHLLW